MALTQYPDCHGLMVITEHVYARSLGLQENSISEIYLESLMILICHCPQKPLASMICCWYYPCVYCARAPGVQGT